MNLKLVTITGLSMFLLSCSKYSLDQSKNESDDNAQVGIESELDLKQEKRELEKQIDDIPEQIEILDDKIKNITNVNFSDNLTNERNEYFKEKINETSLYSQKIKIDKTSLEECDLHDSSMFLEDDNVNLGIVHWFKPHFDPNATNGKITYIERESRSSSNNVCVFSILEKILPHKVQAETSYQFQPTSDSKNESYNKIYLISSKQVNQLEVPQISNRLEMLKELYNSKTELNLQLNEALDKLNELNNN